MPERLVVMVEPEAAVAQEVAALLRRRGARLERLAEGAELLARREAPSLIVLCIDPPLPTGWSLCSRVRKNAVLKSVPLVITSAQASEADFEAHRKFQIRADDYLRKPFAAEELVERITMLLGLGPDAPDAPDAPAVAEPPAAATTAPPPGEDIDLPIEEPDLPPSSPANLGAADEPAGSDNGVAAAEAAVAAGLQRAEAALAALDPTDGAPSPPPAEIRAEQSRAVAVAPKVELSPDFRALVNAAPVPAPAAAQPTASPAAAAAAAAAVEAPAAPVATPPETSAAATASGRVRTLSNPNLSRETLQLREVIRQKEREILELRDQLDAKDRTILDHKDQVRKLEHLRNDLEERLLAVETELVGANEQLETVAATRDEAGERERGLKVYIADMQRQIDRLQGEAAEWKERHDGAVEAAGQAASEIEAQLEQLTRERDEAQATVERLASEHAQAMAGETERHERALQDLVEETDRREREFAELREELDRVRASGGAELEALRAEVDARAERIAELEGQAQEAAERLHRDENAVVRARRALAIALTLLERP